MSRAIAIFTGGVTELRQVAVREDGAVFRRGQRHDPRYGYRWSAWAATGETLDKETLSGISEMSAGFASLHLASPTSSNINNRALFDAKGEIRVRLP